MTARNPNNPKAPIKLYVFEGEMLSARQIHERVPVISERSVPKHIEAGRNTRAAMLQHCPTRAMKVGGAIGRKRSAMMAGGKFK